ncbi:PfkB family carbohydrate kinase [Akkermansia sp.]|uniref:PfkB family carbohydrate kinase n=1 Tax=Akkermansia sp. TaxID=1872421 RepID=UPI003AB0CA0E
MSLTIKSEQECRWDIASLGEVMLRLDPGEGRIHTTRSFRVCEGGGEYNVARGLRRCFRMRGAIVTAICDNPVGRLLEDCMLQGGLDMDYVAWKPFDGIGRDCRVGLNFTERGYGVRAAVGCSDRGLSAACQMKPGEVDWDALFGRDGVRWFHTGGIYAGLSETTSAVVLEAVQAARRHGSIVSYDLNYRPSLWKSIGGQACAQEVNRAISPFVDVMIGNEEDFQASLGLSIEGSTEDFSRIDHDSYRRMIRRAVKEFGFKAAATTLRVARTATLNDWAAMLYYDGEFSDSISFPNLEILDRVGGGDSFASGLIYGLLSGKGPQYAVNCGCAHGALAMTTPGDTSTATLAEVEKVMKGGTARVDR